ncbi:MAG: hypothetical protein IPJ03_18330 [Ignavibacteriales bacterium]|nr:hypothetical protein [Ignavibacteriales bacterium]
MAVELPIKVKSQNRTQILRQAQDDNLTMQQLNDDTSMAMPLRVPVPFDGNAAI